MFCSSPHFQFRSHPFINMQMSSSPNLCRTVSFSCFFFFLLVWFSIFRCLFILLSSSQPSYLPIPSAVFWMFLASLFCHHQPAARSLSWMLVSSKPDRSQSWQTAGRQPHPPTPHCSHSSRLCLRLRLEMFYLWSVERDEHVSRVLSEQRFCNWGVSRDDRI